MAMTQYTGDTEIITNIGTTPQERGLTADQFKAKFDEGLKAFVTWFNSVHKTEFDAHLAEAVSHALYVTRDLSLAGTQIISIPFQPKNIRILAYVDNAANKRCQGFWSQNLFGVSSGYCMYHNGNALSNANAVNASADALIMIVDSAGNYTMGKLQSVSDTDFKIVWSKVGIGATGTATLLIQLETH
jgi:hypothetical protein